MFKALIKRVTVFVAVLVGSICLLLLACQRSLIYYPRGYQGFELEEAQRISREIRYRTGEGDQVAFYVAPPDAAAVADPAAPPDRVWVVAGGNGSRALDWLYFARDFGEAGTGFLLFDYPGYGLNEGRASPSTIREASLEALGALGGSLELPESDLGGRTAVLGHSLGAAAGLVLANDIGIERAVLIAPFTTMTEMARETVGRPLCYLLLHRFDNRKEIERLIERGGRVTIFHGLQDNIIPPEMGRELAEMFPEGAVEFIPVERSGHNDIVANAEDAIREAMRRR
ncbi:hypothetical protein BH23VER1_BH23VER1_30840 [soil metagenome]